MQKGSTVNSQQKKLVEALKLLEDAAEEQLGEIQEMIRTDFPELKQTLFSTNNCSRGHYNSIKSQISEKFGHAREVSEEKIKEMGTRVDAEIHSNPWPFIGSIALLSFILGILIGHDD